MAIENTHQHLERKPDLDPPKIEFYEKVLQSRLFMIKSVASESYDRKIMIDCVGTRTYSSTT